MTNHPQIPRPVVILSQYVVYGLSNRLDCLCRSQTLLHVGGGRLVDLAFLTIRFNAESKRLGPMKARRKALIARAQLGPKCVELYRCDGVLLTLSSF